MVVSGKHYVHINVRRFLSISTLLVWACAGSNNLFSDIALLSTSTDGLSPPAATLVEEAQRHARTRITGAVTGGLGGGLASLFPSRRSSSGTRGVVSSVAGGIGAELGYAFGDYIDARNTRANMDQQKLSLLVTAAQNDTARYEQDQINAMTAIAESQNGVHRLNDEYPSASYPRGAYQQEARTLAATANALQVLIRESTANEQFISQDVLEAHTSGRSRVKTNG